MTFANITSLNQARRFTASLDIPINHEVSTTPCGGCTHWLGNTIGDILAAYFPAEKLLVIHTLTGTTPKEKLLTNQGGV